MNEVVTEDMLNNIFKALIAWFKYKGQKNDWEFKLKAIESMIDH